METKPIAAGPPADSVSFLNNAYAALARTNPRFSLRGFAQKIGLSPGGLSQILARKKKLSLQRAYEIAHRLNLSTKDTDYFILLVQIEGTKDQNLKADLTDKLVQRYPDRTKSNNLSLDHFRLISDWYGLAILEYISARSDVSSVQKIASYFDISRSEAIVTLERLEKLTLIQKTPRGHYQQVTKRVFVSSSTPSEAIRNYYTSVGEKSQTSIHRQTPQQKVIGTEVIAFDPTQLDEVRKLADTFLVSLEKLAAKGKRRTEVYQAFFNFFKLNTPNKGENP